MTAPSVATSPSMLATCRDLTVAYGSGEARVVALDRVNVEFAGGETVALWGPSGLGQDDAAARTRGARRADRRGRSLERRAVVVARRLGPRTSTRPRDRLRVPGVEPASRIHGVRKHRLRRVRIRRARPTSKSGRSSCSPSSDCARRRTACRRSSPAAKHSAWRSLARSRRRPRLLLCDEPTGHLDTDTTARVLEMIDALQRRFGFTLVVATHDADIAAGLGRFVELRDGRVVEDER